MFKTNFYTRLKNWEFWPWQIVYIPVILYYIWLSIKARSLFFFFSTNPGIEGGGLLAESKHEILKKIPEAYKPKTLIFKAITGFEEIMETILDSNIHFPVICKPDYGERGWMVEKINDSRELEKYVKNMRINFLVQEFVDKPIELGIFYVRIPDQDKGTITSIVQKELLFAVGNGKNTVHELMSQNERAKLYINQVENRNPDILNLVPQKNERVELVPIGNHSRGTTFLDGTHLITPPLVDVFDDLAKKINGFYYGRFDLRCDSVDQLYRGIGFKILELNGAKSEPAHIYHPGFSMLQAYRTLIYHWNLIFKIASLNRINGHPYPSFNEGWAEWKKFLAIRRDRKRKVYQGKTSSPSA